LDLAKGDTLLAEGVHAHAVVVVEIAGVEIGVFVGFFFLLEPVTKVTIRTLGKLAIPSLRSLQIRLVAP
jgi:hypothetical protein